MRPGMLDGFFANNFVDNILSVPGKIIILVVFLSFFGLMFWQGMLPTHLTPDPWPLPRINLLKSPISPRACRLSPFLRRSRSGFYNVEKGLRISALAQDDSALLEFSLVLEEEFQTFSAAVVTQSDDFPGAQAVGKALG